MSVSDARVYYVALIWQMLLCRFKVTFLLGLNFGISLLTYRTSQRSNTATNDQATLPPELHLNSCVTLSHQGKQAAIKCFLYFFTW